jgi:hypothetical protein
MTTHDPLLPAVVLQRKAVVSRPWSAHRDGIARSARQEGRPLPLAPPCNRQRCGCCGTGVRYHPGFSGGVAARDFDAPGLRIGKFDTSPLSCDG